MSWNPGRRAALLGPNGAGKSTLFALGCGAASPHGGSVRLHDRPVRPGEVGWMPQHIQALPGLRCREQVALAGWMQGMSRTEAWTRAADALHSVGLVDDQHEKATSLSGGQLRRLGVAELLVTDPSTVLLDEPTVGLDPLQRKQALGVIADLAQRCQIIVATHLVEDLSLAFDTVTVLVEGAIRFDGSVQDFLALGGEAGSPTEQATAAYAVAVGSANR